MCNTFKGQKRESDLLALKLQMAESQHRGAGSPTESSAKARSTESFKETSSPQMLVSVLPLWKVLENKLIAVQFITNFIGQCSEFQIFGIVFIKKKKKTQKYWNAWRNRDYSEGRALGWPSLLHTVISRKLLLYQPQSPNLNALHFMKIMQTI